MSLALVQSRALLGLQAPPVTVEVHLANGLPSFTLVGLADVEVKEARERVRSALQNAGLEFPHNKRITVNLAPADLPKDSGRFDLPIALGILAASGQIDGARLAGYEFAGELSLSGELRPIRGALAMSFAMRRESEDQARAFVLPLANADEAALVSDAAIYPARSLLEVCAHFVRGAGAAPLARHRGHYRGHKPAVVLDIDDTSLSLYECAKARNFQASVVCSVTEATLPVISRATSLAASGPRSM